MNEKELFKIPEEALNKIKSLEEFEEFIQRLYKQGVESLLKAEINEHLGYTKYDPSGKNSGNSRNGFSLIFFNILLIKLLEKGSFLKRH